MDNVSALNLHLATRLRDLRAENGLTLEGLAERPAFRMPWSPWSGYLTFGFLGAVALLILLDYPTGTLTFGAVVVLALPALAIGCGIRKVVHSSPCSAQPMMFCTSS